MKWPWAWHPAHRLSVRRKTGIGAAQQRQHLPLVRLGGARDQFRSEDDPVPVVAGVVGGVPGGEAGNGEHDSVGGFDAVSGAAATERDGGPVLLEPDQIGQFRIPLAVSGQPLTSNSGHPAPPLPVAALRASSSRTQQSST
ncbi:hypothetical protein [Streptomyces griseoflavus]|uniref:hypothetical protein n=1 Tax=Streptomyces griseoflavus TaxID=35619 RepID=UPI0033FA0A50